MPKKPAKKKSIKKTVKAVKKSVKKASAKKVKRTKTAARKKPVSRKTSLKKKKVTRRPAAALRHEQEAVGATKFELMQEQPVCTAAATIAQQEQYSLPVRYGDNRIVILPRDPWWMYTYWDITEERVSEIVASIPVYERENLRWIVRVYDVSGVRDFNGSNAHSFFDADIRFEANNWYINNNQPEREWCVEIGLVTPQGKFFAVARSNIIKSPYFGISSVIDEEWAMPDEEYFKLLGVYDLGKSSLERRQKIEEVFKRQISSPLASWGISSFEGKPLQEQDKFFLEVWTEVIVYGRTEADAHVTVEGKKIPLRPDGTFSLRYALPEGDFTYAVSATSKNKKHKRKIVPAVTRYTK